MPPTHNRGMTTTLITGANKGLGYETARRLIEAGHTVWMAARDPQRGRQAADTLGGRFVQLDVTDDESVAVAAETVAAAGGLDVLVNNAGITGSHSPAVELTAVDALEVYNTNVVSIVRVTNAFVPLLRDSTAPTIVNDQRFGLLRSRARRVAHRVDSQRAALHVLEVGRHHAHRAVRPGVAGDAHQRRRPRLHRHRSERPQRAADGDGRDRRRGRAGDPWRPGPHRHVHRPVRRRTVLRIAVTPC